MAIMRLSTPINPWPQADDLIRELPELLEFYRVTGADSYIMKLVVSSIAHLELVINLLVPYGPLTTAIVLSAPIPEEPIKQAALARSEEATQGDDARKKK